MFRANIEVGASAQLRFVDRNPKRRRNRLKIGANFLATLPETDGYQPNKNEHEPEATITIKPNLTPEQQTGKL